MAKGNELIGVDIIGEERIAKLLARYPPEVHDAVTEDVADYLINIFQTYPTPKRVTRKQAFGSTFFSDRQRHWFFANLAEGNIDVPYRRTQGFRLGWKKIGEGKNTIVVNESDAGPYLMDNQRQSRLQAIIGWKKIGETLKERAKRIDEIIEGTAKRIMRKLGAK